MEYHELIDALTCEDKNALDYIDDAVEMLEHLYSELKAANARFETLNKMVTKYQDELIPGYRERAEKAERERDDALTLIRSYQHICGETPQRRIQELVEADRDGRCITHQVKVGDGVWFTTYGETPVYFTINSVFLQIDGTRECFYYQVINSFGNSDYFYGEDLNKTVFITHEAAEAALKASEQDA